MNWSTIILAALIFGGAAFVVVRGIRRQLSGEGGCNCSSESSSCGCGGKEHHAKS